MKERKALPCEACGEGNLHSQTSWNEVEYKGRKGKIRHHHSVCDVCGADLADTEEMRHNRREWRRFCKEVDNVPLGKEIAAMRKLHGLTQEEAGRLFGGGPVAFSKYENDDLIPDEAMANLLYMAIHHPEIVSWLPERKSGPQSAAEVEAAVCDPFKLEMPVETLQGWRLKDMPTSSVWLEATILFGSAARPIIRKERYSSDYSTGANKWAPRKSNRPN